jgi:hypothetical protein
MKKEATPQFKGFKMKISINRGMLSTKHYNKNRMKAMPQIENKKPLAR